MSYSGNLLPKSSYKPKLICLYSDKEQQSDISSEQQNPHHQHHPNCPINHHHANHQCYSHQANTYSMNRNTLPQQKRPSTNLLQMPSQDYREKSQIYLQKRIEQRVIINHQKQMYYGKRKNKVIEISDVSSEEESQERQNKGQKLSRRIAHDQEDEDQLLRRYSVGDVQPQRQKKAQKAQQAPKNDNPFAHLHPDFQEEKKGPSDHDQSSDQLSHIDSNDSLIIIRPKKKHIHKRLRKMTNVTNRVKIQSKQNGGQTQDCPICLTDLNKKEQKKKGKLPCKHIFCLKCITESSKFSNRCPYCRATFNQIKCNGKRIEVEDTRLNEEFEDPNDEPCYVCGRNNDFEHLLECEFCQYAYCHTYCDPRLNDRVLAAEQPWYCASCEELMRHRLENGEEDEDGENYEQEIVQEGQEQREQQRRRGRRIENQQDEEYEASVEE